MGTLDTQVDNRLDLNSVRVLVAVAEHGFRGAAQRLGLPKSTVSKRVADLEAQLGQRLLTRTTRRLALTEVGRAFLERATPALEQLTAAASVVQRAGDTPRGVLRISASATMAELVLGRFLGEFSRDYPEVRLVLDLTDRYVDLVAGGYDVALRAGTLADSSLRARLLTQSGTTCFASPAYLERKGTPKTPEALVEHDTLGFGTERTDVRWPFVVRGKRREVVLRPRVTANSFLLLRELAELGLGIARVPRTIVERTQKAKLVEVLTPFAPPPTPMHAVYAPGRDSSPAVRAFLDALTRKLALRG